MCRHNYQVLRHGRKKKKEESVSVSIPDNTKELETEEAKSSVEDIYNKNNNLSISIGNTLTENEDSDLDELGMTNNVNIKLKNPLLINRIDFTKEQHNEMTYGRRVALKMMNNKYYNPNAGVVSKREDCTEIPSLEKAWAYFEHNVLSRYIVESGDDGKENELEMAEPGEDKFPTKLYSFISTPLNQMGDFGIGIGLYFFTLRFLFYLTIFAGIMSIPNILYYNSGAYNNEKSNQQTYILLLKGTAICTDVSWVPCPTCINEEMLVSQNRTTTSSEGLNFALKNNCESPPLTQGMCNYATIILMYFGFYWMNRQRDSISVKFDEDEQTAQDYSLMIKNPPSDAADPEEWKSFFSQFHNGHITSCTICVENDLLLQNLAQRRERYKDIERLVPYGTKLDDVTLARLAAEHKLNRNIISKLLALFLHPFGLCLDLPALYKKIIVLNAEILGLLNCSYPVTNVFLTFEKEEAKRRVLTELSVGIFDKLKNNVEALSDQNYCFRSKYVLDIFEPEEPSTIIWENIDVGFKRHFLSISVNLLFTFMGLCLIVYIIGFIHEKSVLFGSLTISFFNTIFPLCSRMMTRLECHYSESNFQTSLYVKVALFRFVNYVLIVDIISRFTSTLSVTSEGLLIKVYSNFVTLLVSSNAIQLSDFAGFFKRCILGPRAKDQDSMNMYFQGHRWDLAERYTNMSNNIFLCFFYCTLYPVCFFMSSIALFINFYIDKYSLMRTWARPSKLGTSISKINKDIFSPVARILLIVMSSYWWSGFPYDNLCETGTVNQTYVGLHYIDPTTFVTINQNQTSYKFCNQNLLLTSFPPLSSAQGENQWMTKDQELITDIFGYTSIIIIVALLLEYIFFAMKSFYNAYKGIPDFHGQYFDISFSDVRSRSAYIPQVKSTKFPYPLIATDINDIDHELFEWTDPDRPYEFYSIYDDAMKILYGDNKDGKTLTHRCFSKVYYWPPPSD